jgi:hypothetical protein
MKIHLEGNLKFFDAVLTYFIQLLANLTLMALPFFSFDVAYLFVYFPYLERKEKEVPGLLPSFYKPV